MRVLESTSQKYLREMAQVCLRSCTSQYRVQSFEQSVQCSRYCSSPIPNLDNHRPISETSHSLCWLDDSIDCHANNSFWLYTNKCLVRSSTRFVVSEIGWSPCSDLIQTLGSLRVCSKQDHVCTIQQKIYIRVGIVVVSGLWFVSTSAYKPLWASVDLALGHHNRY